MSTMDDSCVFPNAAGIGGFFAAAPGFGISVYGGDVLPGPADEPR